MIKSYTLILALGFCLSPQLALAKAKADAPEVEVKCLVAENKVAEISEKLGLAAKPPLIRVVCFFDTGSLDLFQHDPRLILRSRYEPSKKTDTTVKVRGGKVKGDDVKCEFDKVIGKEKTESCSVTNKDQGEEEIKKANTGKDIKKIFSKKQEALAKGTFEKLNWDKLQPYGPVEGVQVWKEIEMPGGPPLTVERWELPARPGKPARVLFEVSAKVSQPEEDKTAKWIANLLGVSESGSEESETKTRIVLEHFAGHSP